MPALVSDYRPVDLYPRKSVATVQTMRRLGRPRSSLTVMFTAETYDGLNQRQLRLLDEFKLLKANWDGDDAAAPDKLAIQQAEHVVQLLDRTAQKVFHVAPGPNREIMVDIRKEGKSVEILFYPDRAIYVLFPRAGMPQQYDFTWNDLPAILEWLNG